MVLVLLLVLQGGELLDGQLAVPPLVSQVVQSFLAVELQEDSANKRQELLLRTSTQLTSTFNKLQLMAPHKDQKEHRRHAKKLLNCVLYGNWWNRLTC